MADESIRKDFVEGVNEIFTTLFNSGVEDGIRLYLLSESTTPNVYGENKYKVYKEPLTLVAKAEITPTTDVNYVEEVKDNAVFTVPLKSLNDNNLGVTNDDLDTLRKGVIEFHGTYYDILNILPKAYIEDVFLMYSFVCKENKHLKSLVVEKPIEDTTEEEKEEGVVDNG